MDYKDIDFLYSPFRTVTTISKGHAEAWAATFNVITKVLCNACEGTDQSEQRQRIASRWYFGAPQIGE